MKPLALAVVLFLSGLGGACGHVSPPAHRQKVLLAVSMPGGAKPTPEQAIMLNQKFEQELSALGYALTVDPSLAELILRVEFTPDTVSPQQGGVVRVLTLASARPDENQRPRRDSLAEARAQIERATLTWPQ